MIVEHACARKHQLEHLNNIFPNADWNVSATRSGWIYETLQQIFHKIDVEIQIMS